MLGLVGTNFYLLLPTLRVIMATYTKILYSMSRLVPLTAYPRFLSILKHYGYEPGLGYAGPGFCELLSS